MTRLLHRAFVEAAKLSEDDQDAIAMRFLEEILSEQRWQELFTKSQDLLVKLADEALAEEARGETDLLDPDTL